MASLELARARQRAAELLGRIGASIDPDRLVATLSMPEQQLVEIAKALGADARIVIMDEPTASLDGARSRAPHPSIAMLKEHGVGIIYISHRLEEVFAVADRVTVLRDGRTIADVRPQRRRQGATHSDDGRARAVGRVSKANDSSRPRRPRSRLALAVGGRDRRRVVFRPPGRDPRCRRARRLGPHAARRNALRADAGRQRAGAHSRAGSAAALAAGRHPRRACLCTGGPPPARRRPRDVGRCEYEPGKPRRRVVGRPDRRSA